MREETALVLLLLLLNRLTIHDEMLEGRGETVAPRSEETDEFRFLFFSRSPLRFLSVILKLRAQKLLLEKILAPSDRSAKMSFRCWSTSAEFEKMWEMKIYSEITQ